MLFLAILALLFGYKWIACVLFLALVLDLRRQ